jgi:hypothetical protein
VLVLWIGVVRYAGQRFREQAEDPSAAMAAS